MFVPAVAASAAPIASPSLKNRVCNNMGKNLLPPVRTRSIITLLSNRKNTNIQKYHQGEWEKARLVLASPSPCPKEDQGSMHRTAITAYATHSPLEKSNYRRLRVCLRSPP